VILIPTKPPVNGDGAIVICVAGSRVRGWVGVLAENLKKRLARKVVIAVRPTTCSPRSVWPEKLERLVSRSPNDFGRFVTVDAVPFDAVPGAALVIDATGNLTQNVSSKRFSLRLNGRAIEEAIVDALWTDGPPRLTVEAFLLGKMERVYAALLALPERERLAQALDDIWRRGVSLLVEAAEHELEGKPLPATVSADDEPPAQGNAMLKQFCRGSMLRKSRGSLRRNLCAVTIGAWAIAAGRRAMFFPNGLISGWRRSRFCLRRAHVFMPTPFCSNIRERPTCFLKTTITQPGVPYFLCDIGRWKDIAAASGAHAPRSLRPCRSHEKREWPLVPTRSRLRLRLRFSTGVV
jgi:hypothetical protein